MNYHTLVPIAYLSLVPLVAIGLSVYLAKFFHSVECESFIEERLYNALTKRGYDVKPQYPCGPYFIDLALPRYRIAIECDGKDFHSSPAQKRRDAKRTAYLRRHGWKTVLRFTGSQINKNVSICADKIEKKIGAG